MQLHYIEQFNDYVEYPNSFKMETTVTKKKA